MKKGLLIMMGILMLTGCGKVTDSDDGFTAVEKRETASEQTEHRKDTEESAVEAMDESEETEKAEEVSEDAAAEESSDESAEAPEEEEIGFTWADVADQEFLFASGAGAWGTVMTIREDGSFEGNYHDSDMGDTGDGYPNGTAYYCDFNGKFSAPVKENDYTYRFELEDIRYADEPGLESITDEILYKYTEAYGLSEGRAFCVYLPGAPVDELPEDFLSWVFYSDMDQTLPIYGIYNIDAKYGFSGSKALTVYEQAMQSLEATQSSADLMNERLESNMLSQIELNDLSRQLYEECDNELNYLWSLIKENLSESRYQVLLKEQRQWIKDKEAKVVAEGEEWGQGTMRPLVENTTAAEITMKRCYELVEYLK